MHHFPTNLRENQLGLEKFADFELYSCIAPNAVIIIRLLCDYIRRKETMDIIRAIEQQQIKEVAPFNVGDTVKVHYRIKEGNRERIQVFQGDVIRRQGASARETFTVRKISFGVGVERTFPVYSPKIEKIEVTRHGDVRRAKLYYLRKKVGKAAKIKEKVY